MRPLLVALVMSGCELAADVVSDESPQEAALAYAHEVEDATGYHCEGRLVDFDGWIPCVVYRGDAEPLAIECRASLALGSGCR